MGTWRSRARALAVELGFVIGLLVIAEVVVRVSGWDRLWVLLVVIVVGRSARVAVQHRLRRRAAGPRGVRQPG